MRRLAHRLFAICSAVSLVLGVAVCGLAGCMPLKQQNVTGGQQYDHFSYRGRYGLLQIGPSNVPKAVSVVDAESYAIAPNGKQYGIETEPHREGESPYVEDRVYLVDAKGRRGNVFVGHGRWEFLFVLETPSGRDTRQFTVDSWTFNYVPLIHGPPN